MVEIDTFSLFIMLCVLAPLLGAFTLLFLFIFEKRLDVLQRQAREIALERELQTALYNQLNQEIQPHFFFNTLNSILSLARLDRKKELIHSIETLSKLLKFKYQTNAPFITVHEELTYVNYYLDIQKTRFRDRLTYHLHMDHRVERAIIIPFLIQTLVENAFKHSFEKYAEEAHLEIHVKEIAEVVTIHVWNSAFIHEPSSTGSDGLGLDNIKKRLELLFPQQHTSIELTYAGNRTCVTVIFPFMERSE